MVLTASLIGTQALALEFGSAARLKVRVVCGTVNHGDMHFEDPLGSIE